MPNNIEKCDVVVVSFSNISNDARTLNFLKILEKNKYNVCTISFGDKTEIIRNEEIHRTDFFIEIGKHKRTWKNWQNFNERAKEIVKKIETQKVVASDLYSLPVAKKIATKNKCGLIYDSREIYSALGNLHAQPIKQKILSSIEKYYVKSVSRIITSGELDADYLANYLDFPRTKFTVIYNYPPYKAAVNSNIIRETFHIPNTKKILLYQGVLLENRGIKRILRVLRFLPDVVFCIIGDGPYKEHLIMDIKRRKLEDKVFMTGNIDYEELHYWTCSADLGFALFEPVSLSYKFALPNKLFEYCMAHIPSIVSDLPALRKINNVANITYLINLQANDEELADAIYKLLYKEIRYQLINNCSQYSQQYAYETQEANILYVLNAK